MNRRAPLLTRCQMIVFDGDSLTSRRTPPSFDTWPFLHLMNWQVTYPDEVAKLLFCLRPDLKLRFHNAAVGGSSCRDLLRRFDAMVLPHKPDWVVMTIGGNDCAQRIPLDEFRAAMAKYAARVRDECGGRTVFLGNILPCPYAPDAKAASLLQRRGYYRVLRDVAKDAGGLYVDVGHRLREKAVALYRMHPAHTVYGDGGHFNAVGSIIVAGEVLRAFGFDGPLISK